MSTNPGNYFYPGTEILKNKVGLMDQDLVTIFERNRTALRALELKNDPVQGEFDLKHLLEVHRRLFQDIYAWAGEVRLAELEKIGYG